MVTWHRENGNLPEGRSRILLDNTLRIEDTRPEDQGRYVCKGHNEGGNVTIAVKLHIYGKYTSNVLTIWLNKRIEIHSFLLSASPTFIEAPSDVEVNEGGSVKLPCRAQGRPKPRIIWDRIGGAAISQLKKQQQLGGGGGVKVPQYMEKDSQEDLLVKAKIMSLRLKRSIVQQQPSANVSRNVAMIIDRSKRNKHDRTTFDQIMRNEYHEEVSEFGRMKRQVDNGDAKRDDVDDDDDNDDDDADDEDDGDGDGQSPGAIPILVFSTQAPQEVLRLQVTDNGELILLDVSERDQV